MKMKLLLLFPLLLFFGCGSSDESSPITPAPPQKSSNIELPDNSTTNNFKKLLFGNSHIKGLASILTTLITRGEPQKTIEIKEASRKSFLSTRLSDGESLNLLSGTSWTHVILQGQKYSVSQQNEYPTDAAQRLIFLSKNQGATPVLFPEHPQQGRRSEGQYVHSIHAGIADIQSSCVAPVGLTWDKVIELQPELVLHNFDDNHASYFGRFLSALVCYEVITGNSADLLPYIDTINVDAQTQDFLGQMVSEMISENPPCD